MTSYDPPSLVSNIFNDSNFTNLSGSLNIGTADRRYLRLTGGNVVGNCTFKNINMSALTTSDNITVNKSTGDLITLNASNITGRCSILSTIPNNSLEQGIRGSNEGIFPNTYYRYSNGQFRFTQELSTGNAFNYGSFNITRDAGNQLSIATADSAGRSNVLMTTPTNTLELGIREATGSFPNSFYRHMNGQYRYVQNINGNSQHFGQYVIDTSGSHLSLKNGSNVGFMEINASNILRTVAGISVNQDINGVRIDSIGNTASARSRLDLGSAAGDRTFSLFNNTTSYYGISANNNALQYQSNLNHLWTTGCTDASPLGATIMSMNNTGSLTCYDNTIMKKGFFIERQAFSSSGRSGRGISAFYASSDSVAKIFAYNYSTPAFEGLQLGNIMLVHGASQSVTIDNGVTIAGSYPLTVSNWFNTSFVGSYGFLSSSGSGTGGSTGSADVSIYANKRVWCQEVDAFSDRRLKENIKDLNEDDSIDFVRNVQPVSFNWRADKDKKRSIGYIAQSILKHGKFDELVSLGPDADLKEEIEIIDGKRFISPAGHRFNVSYQSAVPILHSALASAFDLIEDLQDRLEKLESKKKN